MTHPQTIADIEALIEHIDSELVALQALIAEGRRLRANLVKELERVRGRPVELVWIKP